MKRLCLTASVVVVLGLAMVFSPLSLGADKQQKMIDAAKALDQEFIAAFNSGDVEAMSACYWNSPDVISFPPDAFEARGFAAVKAGISAMLGSMQGGKLELTEMHHIPTGDSVIGWGLWRMTLPGPDGKPVTTVGRYTDVKAERDGKWVYLLDHASTPMQ